MAGKPFGTSGSFTEAGKTKLMFVDVALTHVEVNHIDLSSYGAVAVIDILRATTTILTALENGARGVVPVSTPEEATMWRNQHHNVVLGGERGAKRIDGFDLGNSPLEYSPMTVAGKIVVLTTTNGTQTFQRVSSIGPGGGHSDARRGHGRGPGAIHAAGPAIGDHSHAAAEEGPGVRRVFATPPRWLRWWRIVAHGARALIVCSGTDGRFSREDAYGAAVILLAWKA